MSFNASHWDRHEPSMDNLRRWEEMSGQGSHQLRLRIEAMFDNWAARHRITFGEAKVANLYPGVKL